MPLLCPNGHFRLPENIGKHGRCRLCARTRQKKHYYKDLGDSRRNYREWRKKNLSKVLWGRARQRAKEKQIPFSVDPLPIPEIDPVTGKPFCFCLKQGCPLTPSYDRFENSRGYVEGNVWIISRRANSLKNDASLAELKQLVSALEARHVQ